MLIQIKKLLQQREQMTLSDLSKHFYVSEAMMLSMLDQWLKKGRLERIELGGICGSSCGSCEEPSQVSTLYKWKSVAQKSIYTKSA